jgi:uncharacterized protein (TIGR02996 family)
MTTSAPDLLRAILNDTEDDAVRLVYADWLEDHGQSERAEFIRGQIELARLEAPFGHPLDVWGLRRYALYRANYAGPEHAYLWGKDDESNRRQRQLGDRLRALEQAHAGRWLQEVPAWARERHLIRRGFVEGVTTGARGFLQKGAGLCRRTPLLHAELTNAAACVAELARSPLLGRLETLRFACGPQSAGALRGDGLRALARSPHLANVAGLVLSGQHTGPEGAKALSEIPFRRLQGLDLRGNDLDDQAVQALARAPALAGLKALAFHNPRVGAEGWAALAASPTAASLTHLFAGSIVPDDLAALLRGRPLANLVCVDLNSNLLGPGGGVRLAGNPALGRLRVLEIANTVLCDGGLQALVASPNLESLAFLNVATNGISDDGVRALAREPRAARLRGLNLRNNRLTDAAGLALAESPYLRGLRVLLVSGFSDKVRQRLRDVLNAEVC